jgi:dethiobiotin synthetase
MAPHLAARAEGRDLPYEEVLGFCRAAMGGAAGPLLIEGAGGVMAPLGDTRTNLDLMAELGAPALFVAGSYLGAVSHALSGLECIERRGLQAAAVIVNETPGGAGLADTVAMLTAQRPDLPIQAAPRAPAAPAPVWAKHWAARLGL